MIAKPSGPCPRGVPSATKDTQGIAYPGLSKHSVVAGFYSGGVRKHTYSVNSIAHQSLPLRWDSMGMIGFDITCVSIGKRAENAELSRKRPLQTIGANTKRTDFALAA
jgi:hypothetical protein